MPASAHKHQVISTRSPVFQYEQKYFREYFHWNEVGFARGQQRTNPTSPGHDLMNASSRVLGRWRESTNGQQQLTCSYAPLVDPVRMCAIHAEGAWPVRKMSVSGWTISRDRASEKCAESICRLALANECKGVPRSNLIGSLGQFSGISVDEHKRGDM